MAESRNKFNGEKQTEEDFNIFWKCWNFIPKTFFSSDGNLLKVADAEKTNKFATLKMFIKRVGSLTE